MTETNNSSNGGAGRPKGRKYASFTVSLTSEQISWLNNQSNASETVRKLIDADMENKTETPESNRAKRLNALNDQLKTATMKRAELLHENKRHFKGCEKRDLRGTDSDGNPYYYDPHYVIENENDPTPIDKTGEILKAQFDAFNAEIRQLNEDIDYTLRNLEQPQKQKNQNQEELTTLHNRYEY